MDDISTQVLKQTSEDLSKICELSARIDERVEILDDRLSEVLELSAQLSAVAEGLDAEKGRVVSEELESLQDQILALDKRVTAMEFMSSGQQDRWKAITNFIVQLIWIVLAAWVLMKLNLTTPAIP